MNIPYFCIGNVKILRTAALAPMASVADRAYRIVCKEYGASYMVSEMISAKGLCYSDRKTEELCRVTDCERPYALQIFGSEPEFMGKAAGLLMKYKPDIIDINMGCPVPKILKNGDGCAVMKDPDLAYSIVKAAVSSCDVPVTVKIRSGWDETCVNAPEIASVCESAGAAAVTVHGRTKKQLYDGKADRDIIRRVKETVKIPVIGNGDIDSAQSALDMYERTGCDLVMAGRGSYGNPFLFGEIAAALGGTDYTPPTLDLRLETMLCQAELSVRIYGEYNAMKRCRSQCALYLKGIPSAAAYRNRCSSLGTLDDLREIIAEIRNEVSE